MKAFRNKLNNKALAALLIAATGIPVSSAWAQFRIEHSAKAESANESKDEHSEQSSMIYKGQDDEHTYEIKIVDGKITIAKLDGSDFDKDQVKIKGEVMVFVDEDGQTLHEIKMPKAHLLGERTHKINLAFTPENGKDGQYSINAQLSQPKVMLGINLGEPSKALRKHLKLSEEKQAILVEKVIEGLPADLSGLEDYDVIVSIDGSDQASGQLLSKVLAEKDPGDIMKLVVLRGGEKIKLKVKLAQYDPQALGVVISSDTMVTPDENDNVLDILVELEDAELGEKLEKKIIQVQEKIRQQVFESREQHELVRQMQAKAVDAMRDAERQLIEFRDGKLIVRSGGGMQGPLHVLRGNIRDHVENIAPDGVHGHMDSMEERLEELEDRLDRQIDELSEQMDRLAEMFERLMDALEDD